MKTVLIVFTVILKGAGWMLLGVLTLLILVLLIILFVPIRYRISFSNTETVQGKAAATWLVHLFQAEAVLEEKKFRFSYRILWIRKRIGQEKPDGTAAEGERKREKKTAEGTAAEKIKTGAGAEETTAQQEKNGARTADGTTAQKEKNEAEAEGTRQEARTESGKAQEDRAREETKKEEPRAGERGEKGSRFIERAERLKARVLQIYAKAEAAREKGVSLVRRVVEYPGRAAITRRICGVLRYLIEHLRPRRLRLAVRFGFEDPSLTGQCMAAYGILSALYGGEIKGYRIEAEPDFESRRLEAVLDANGRIALYVILAAAFRLLKDRKIRKLIQDIKHRGG